MTTKRLGRDKKTSRETVLEDTIKLLLENLPLDRRENVIIANGALKVLGYNEQARQAWFAGDIILI